MPKAESWQSLGDAFQRVGVVCVGDAKSPAVQGFVPSEFGNEIDRVIALPPLKMCLKRKGRLEGQLKQLDSLTLMSLPTH
ncbi:hypothetical protein QYF36_007050 [Acer negundo]|nr:hypothetical protein QYF36_007050 [Acer negundo]